MTRVLFVCHGNICRSTMAESVMTYLIKQSKLEDQFYVNSAATSREEIGNPPHHGTVRKLRSVGIEVVPHRSVQMTKEDYKKYDYIIGMEEVNIRNILRIIGEDTDKKVYKLMSFTSNPKDVADPWYTGDFDATYEDVVRGCRALLDYLINKIN